MFQNFPESGQTDGGIASWQQGGLASNPFVAGGATTASMSGASTTAAGKAGAGAAKSGGGGNLGAQIADIALSGLVGISNSALAWADAFCVTESCKNKKKRIEADKYISDNRVKEARYGFIGTALETQGGRDKLILYSALGIGALALGAYAITRD